MLILEAVRRFEVQDRTTGVFVYGELRKQLRIQSGSNFNRVRACMFRVARRFDILNRAYDDATWEASQ